MKVGSPQRQVVYLKAEFSMFCCKKGVKIQGKLHGKGLILAPTDKHGFHFYASVPHPGSVSAEAGVTRSHILAIGWHNDWFVELNLEL